MSDPKIIVALDFPTQEAARQLYSKLDPGRCKVKVGKELFTAAGPALVRELVASGFDVFLDLKFHDIPNTVARACKAAAELGVWMMNVHALGGRAMMQAAREGLESYTKRPLLIAVTILTSHSESQLKEIGLTENIPDHVKRLAALTQSSGLDGVVCSPQEVSMLREIHAEPFCLVTPGIRPQGSDKGDQHRIMTPRQAIELGASYLVIGRPITQAPDPMAALAAIEEELAS